MTNSMRTLGISIIFALAAAGFAEAQEASVRVQVTDSAGRPLDGSVTLTAGSRTRRCSTVAGRCTITAPAGTYQATLAPARGRAPSPRSLQVPTTGVVSLSLRALDAPATSTSGTPPRTSTTTGGSTSSSGTTSGSGSTSGSSSSGSTGSAGSTSSGSSGSRNLSSGRTVSVQGQITDSAGRPADASLVVKRGSTTIGTARSTAGRFTLYDLTPGAYTIQATGVRGGSASTSVSISGSVARPSIRLR